MRHYEFIVEYNTQATVKAMGNKIIDALMLPQLLQALKTAVHNKHSMDSMKRELYYIFYRGNDFGEDTHDTFANPTKFLNSVNMTIPRPSLMEFQSLAALKLISYVHEFAVKKMHQDPRDSGWKNTVEHSWREGSKKLEKEIVSDVIKILESFDPTPNKQYTLQIVKWFLDNGSKAFPKIEDGKSTLRESLYYFQKLKARLPEKYRDIRQYKSANEFMDSVQYFKEEYGKKEELPKGQSKIVYNDPKYAKAYWAIDEEGSCYLGQGTQWCTAATKSSNYFDEYDAKGPLLIFHMKEELNYQLQDNYEDDGGHFHMEYAEQTKMFQVHLKVDKNGDWLFGDEDIAAPDDSQMDFADLYDYNDNFREMFDSEEFITAMTKVAEEWSVYTGRAI